MKELNVEDQIYLCKYHEIDDALNISLGISKEEASKILKKLKDNGLYEQYRNLEEEEYEKIIKTEKRKSKNDEFAKILDKYMFDKKSVTYNDIKRVLKESKYAKNENELVLTNIFKLVAAEKDSQTYIINNNCKRALNSAYEKNKKVFIQNGYRKRPSLKDFIMKELKIPEKEENKRLIVEDANILEPTTIPEDIIMSSELNIENYKPELTISVPLRVLHEYYYQKRIFRGFRSRNKNIKRRETNDEFFNRFCIRCVLWSFYNVYIKYSKGE